jgi:hypothetical protein
MVLVLAVMVQASEHPRNHLMGGERGGTIVNVEFIVSVGSGSPCNFKAPLHFVPDKQVASLELHWEVLTGCLRPAVRKNVIENVSLSIP